MGTGTLKSESAVYKFFNTNHLFGSRFPWYDIHQDIRIDLEEID
jgi:hypothetical protein